MPRRTMGLLAMLGVAALLLPLTPDGSVRDVAQTLVRLGCIAVAWHHTRRRTRVRHHGWSLLVLAMGVLACSDAVRAAEVRWWHLDAQALPSDLLGLAGYLALTVAVLQLDRRRSRALGSPGGIETVIFATGALTPVLVFLVLPALST